MIKNNDLNNSMEQIAASMAHEIKNPLALIRANLQLLESSDNNEEHQKTYKIMYRELDRINDLVMEFIHFSKPIEFELSIFKIDELINEVIDSTKASMLEKKITIERSNADANLKIKGDFNKLKQVLINIVKNAIEASTENSTITVEEVENNDFIGVSVIDNGIGIPDDVVSQIGTPYFTTKETGSGLGIAMSKQIVEKHGGIFHISTIEGHGTCVTVLFRRI